MGPHGPLGALARAPKGSPCRSPFDSPPCGPLKETPIEKDTELKAEGPPCAQRRNNKGLHAAICQVTRAGTWHHLRKSGVPWPCASGPKWGRPAGAKTKSSQLAGLHGLTLSSADGCGSEGRTSAPASRCQARRHHWLPAMGQVANGQIHLTADQSTSPCRHHAHPHGATCASSSSLEDPSSTIRPDRCGMA